MRVLMWLSHARKPLSTENLRHALAVQVGDVQLDSGNLPSAKQLVEYCSGLVVIDESGILRLTHASVQMYFHEHREDLFPSGQHDIAQVCLTYLCFQEIGETCTDFYESIESTPQSRADYGEQLDRFPFLT